MAEDVTVVISANIQGAIAKLQELEAKAKAPLGGLSRQTDIVRIANENHDKAVQKVGRSYSGEFVSGINRAITRVIALGAAYISLRTIISSLDELKHIQILATQLGMAASSIQALQGVAIRTGASVEYLRSAMTRLSRTALLAEGSNARMGDALRSVGLNAEQLGKLDIESQIYAIADAFKAAGKSVDLAAVSVVLFDIGGSSMVNMLRQGSGAIKDLMAEMQRLGVTANELDLAKVWAVSQDVDVLAMQIRSRLYAEIARLAPLIHLVTLELGEMLKPSSTDLSTLDEIQSSAVTTYATVKVLAVAVADIFTIANVGITGLSAIFWKMVMGVYMGLQFIEDKWKSLTGRTKKDDEDAWTQYKVRGIQAHIDVQQAAVDINRRYGRIEAARAGEERIKAYHAEIASLMEAGNKAVASKGKDPFGVLFKGMFKGLKEEGDKIPPFLQETADEAGRLFKESLASALTIDVGKLSLTDIMLEDMPKIEKAYEDLAKRLAAIMDKYRRGQLSDQSAWDQKVAQSAAQQQQTLYAQEVDHSAKNVALWQAEGTFMADMQVYKAQVMSEFFGYAVPLMESKHRKMFEIGKAAAIAQTIVDTYAGAMAAFRSFASIPYVGYAMGAAAAASVVAVGMMRVQAIRATQFGGGGGDSKSSMASPSGGGAEVAGPTYTTNVNVSLNGERYSQRQVRDLIGIIGQQQAGNVVVRAQ